MKTVRLLICKSLCVECWSVPTMQVSLEMWLNSHIWRQQKLECGLAILFKKRKRKAHQVQTYFPWWILVVLFFSHPSPHSSLFPFQHNLNFSFSFVVRYDFAFTFSARITESEWQKFLKVYFSHKIFYPKLKSCLPRRHTLYYMPLMYLGDVSWVLTFSSVPVPIFKVEDRT